MSEVSRGHSRRAKPIRLSGTLTRKGRNGQGSHDRKRVRRRPERSPVISGVNGVVSKSENS